MSVKLKYTIDDIAELLHNIPFSRPECSLDKKFLLFTSREKYAKRLGIHEHVCARDLIRRTITLLENYGKIALFPQSDDSKRLNQFLIQLPITILSGSKEYVKHVAEEMMHIYGLPDQFYGLFIKISKSENWRQDKDIVRLMVKIAKNGIDEIQMPKGMWSPDQISEMKREFL